MFSTVQHLCEVEHVLSAGTLKLTSISSIRLSLPPELPFLFLPPSQRLTALVAAGTWVARGNGLKITLNLFTEGSTPATSDREELVEALGVLLRDAEIWTHLGLRAALTFPNVHKADGEARSSIVLGLIRTDPHENTTTFSKRGGKQTLTYDPNPPSGVLTAFLEEVTVQLSLSLVPPNVNLVRKRKVIDTSLEPNRNGPYDQLVGNRNPKDPVDEGAYNSCPHHRKPPQDHPVIPEPTTSDVLELGNDIMLDADSSSQESMVFSDCSQISNSSCSSNTSSPPVLEGNTTETVVENRSVVLGDWAKLIDSSFRRMICGERAAAAQGVRLTKDSRGPKLADVAPALFCPDYLSSMAQRNGLISTIARSLNAVHLRSKSPHFRLDIQRMTGLSLDERIRILRNNLASEANGQNHSDITPVIKLRLWQIAQRILLGPSLGRQLKPMKFDSKRPLGGGASSQVMLDEDVSLHYTVGLPADVEDQILFDDGPSNDPVLSINHNIQDRDWHTLFEDYEELDDESDLLDVDGSEDDPIDSLLFESDESHQGDEPHTSGPETLDLKKSSNGYYNLKNRVAEETLFQAEEIALETSFEGDDSMLEDYDERDLDSHWAHQLDNGDAVLPV